MQYVAGHPRGRKVVGNLFALAVLGGWFLFLSPTNLGGPTGYIEVSGHSMDGTYQTGDLIVTRQQDTYRVGDIIAFEVAGGKVIHRIIGGNGTKGYVTQGDNNPDPDPWHPTDDDVVGTSWIRFPGEAHLLRLPSNPIFAGAMAGLATLLMLLADERREKRSRAGRPADELTTAAH